MEKKRQKKKDMKFKWSKIPKLPSDLVAKIVHPFPTHHTPFNIFSADTDLDVVVKILVEQSNLHAQENGREFQANEEEMKAFLGINCVMTFYKLPTIPSYWECGQYTVKEGIKNATTRTRFKGTLPNLYFSKNRLIKVQS